MKYKHIAIFLSISLGTTALFGCGQSASSAAAAAKEERLYGEITEIGENTITIELGTQKEMPDMAEKDGGAEERDDSAEGKDDSAEEKNDNAEEKDDGTEEKDAVPEGQDADAKERPELGKESAEGTEPGEGMEMPSMLELTGETKEISVTEDTEVTRTSMGQGGGRPEGAASNGEKPEGEMPEGEVPNGEKPEGEIPEGEAPNGENPGGEITNGEVPGSGERENGNVPDMQEEEISFSDLEVGDIISVTVGEDQKADSICVMSMGMGGGMEVNGVESYAAVKEYTQDTEVSGETIESTGTDENGIHVYEGAEVTVKDTSITRTSQSSTGGDSSSFYGVGAALLTTEGTAYIKGGAVDTDANGAAGLFAYGDGTVYAADMVIDTAGDTSGGIHTAGGGTFYAWNLTAETDGESSAAIRSDRGGGKMVVDGGSYISNGVGSPAVYSTADIAVHSASLTANGSESVCIEGLNSLRLYDCSLTGNMADSDQNDCTWNVILYQSMSGDSEVGNSTFEMSGGSLTAKNGGMFYTTNTESTITLADVDITYAEDAEYFLRCTGNQNKRGWGQTGENGADCHFTAVSQEMQGDVVWDSISKLDCYLTDGSTLTGVVRDEEACAGSGGDGYCGVYLDESSVWVVTGDSTLTSLDSAGKIVDIKGNPVTVQGTDGAVYVQGTSEYTVTVETYETAGDVSGASAQTAWSAYEAEKPAQLG